MFRFLKGPPRRLPRPLEGHVCYAIGDIHGCADLLDGLHEIIVADAAAYAPELTRHIVYLGDYIDRGPDSRGVLDRLLTGVPKGFHAHFLRGNHEWAMQQFMLDPSAIELWRAMGANATLGSYGLPPAPSAGALGEIGLYRARFIEAVPPTHRAFLESLETTWTCGDLLFVHAGVRPGLLLWEQSPRDLLTIREPFLSSHADFGAFVVHGHSPSYEIDFQRNRLCIDTGAYASGKLSCAVFDGGPLKILSVERAARRGVEPVV